MSIWTKHDEAKLQRELETVEIWQRVLEKSSAGPMRSGQRGRTECRWLIDRAERAIAELRARKAASQVAA